MNITITVKDGKEKRKLVIKKPGFNELKFAYQVMQKGLVDFGMPDVIGAGKSIIDTCKIEKESDKLFWDDNRAELMIAASQKVSDLVEYFEAELKKN